MLKAINKGHKSHQQRAQKNLPSNFERLQPQHEACQHAKRHANATLVQQQRNKSHADSSASTTQPQAACSYSRAHTFAMYYHFFTTQAGSCLMQRGQGTVEEDRWPRSARMLCLLSACSAVSLVHEAKACRDAQTCSPSAAAPLHHSVLAAKQTAVGQQV
jgi:hypothetical protein